MNIRVIYWIILLSFLHGCTSKSVDKEEQSRNDSIQKYLDLTGNDSIPFEKRIHYTDKAYAMIDLSKNDTLTRYYLSFVSYNYSYFLKNDLLKSTAEKLMKLSLQSKDSLNIAKANRNLGLYYVAISDNEKAISYFFKAKKIFKLINRHDYVIKMMNKIAITQYYASDFLGSNKTSIEMITLSTKANFYKLNKLALTRIADNLSALNNYVEALSYYKKVLKTTKIKSSKNHLYISISDNYINLKQYDSASKYVNLILNDKKLLSTNPILYSKAISLSALIKLENAQYNGLEKKFNLADYYFHRFNSQDGRNYNQIYLSQYYERVHNNKKAIDAANKALVLSVEYKNTTDILASLNQLIKVDTKNASTNAQKYIRVRDSMQITERNFRDKFARIAYETNEITQEKNKAISQKWIVTAVAAVVILFVLLIHIISRQRAKQKELQLQQSHQIANEEIYDLMLIQKNKEEQARQGEKKRIAIELHDGVMNRLASTRLNLNVLSHQKDKETINKCLIHIEGIYKIEQEIRNITHNLTLDNFKDANTFVALLNDFIATQNNTTTSQYSLETDTTIQWDQISSGIKMNLYRIIQEASHNVNKYAQASNVLISLILDENNICLSITDNGKGFDTNANMDGIGLRNIKHRVESLRGKVVIQSNSKSTSINLAIPFVFATG